MPNHFGSYQNMDAIAKIAGSPEGKQLLSMLQSSAGEELKKAIGKASTGDLTQLEAAVQKLLADPEAEALVRKLRNGNG